MFVPIIIINEPSIMALANIMGLEIFSIIIAT